LINVGYAPDGKVVITIMSTAEGKPLKTDVEISPENALKLAAGIKQAAEEGQKVIDERDRTNLN